jgi:hypothetical protein
MMYGVLKLQEKHLSRFEKRSDEDENVSARLLGQLHGDQCISYQSFNHQ